MKLKIVKDFPYFHGGHARKDYVAGTEIETDDEEMAGVAVAEGWAKKIGNGSGKKAEKQGAADQVTAETLAAEILALEEANAAAPTPELQAELDGKRAELAKLAA